MTIPFSEQRLKPDFAADLRFNIDRGLAVGGEDLLRAVEQRMGALPAELRRLYVAFSTPAVMRKGRPPNDRAALDFAMETSMSAIRHCWSSFDPRMLAHRDPV